MRTITYDESIYKLIPVALLNRFPEQNMSNVNEDAVSALNQWGIAVCCTPDDVTCVGAHSGEPADSIAIVEALRPFASLLQEHNSKGDDSKPIFGINYSTITLGDLRRAQSIIDAATKGQS